MTKNTSTPTNPPGNACGQKWQTTTAATASARRPWISGRISVRAVTRALQDEARRGGGRVRRRGRAGASAGPCLAARDHAGDAAFSGLLSLRAVAMLTGPENRCAGNGTSAVGAGVHA